jgi:ELWxxDGT repeat protein
VSGVLYFIADNYLTGRELWKSDGTGAGTVLVKDIRPGYPSAFNDLNPVFTVVGDVLFFRADDGVSGEELWKSDGTGAGTVLVKDIYPGPGNSYPRNLIQVGGTLFFAGFDASTGLELWQSDGTEAGTVLVSDLNPVAGAFSPEVAVQLAGNNGVLYFAADDGVAGNELWRYQPVACQVPDPSLAVVGDTVCPVQGATLTVKGTQAGVAYQVYRENVPVGELRPGGGDLTFPIPALSLGAGANVLSVRATGCAEVPLTQTATVFVLAGAAAPLTGDTTIAAGQAATLAAAGAPPGATYRWYTQAAGGTPVATGTPFTTPVLAADTAYYVSVYRADCFETARTKVNVTVKPAVVSGVVPAGVTGRLAVFPNPAGPLLHVAFPVPLQSPGTLRLYNATGRLLREVQLAAGTRMGTLDVSALPAGMYSLQVGTVREKWAGKVVKP